MIAADCELHDQANGIPSCFDPASLGEKPFLGPMILFSPPVQGSGGVWYCWQPVKSRGEPKK